jgi:rubrerythrin
MSSLSSPTTRDTLLRAIQIEARNATIYQAFADLFQGYDDSVTGIFREMAIEEQQHGAELEQRYRERFGERKPPEQEPKEVIEAFELEDPEALIFDSLTVAQALETGLRAEEAAREFYGRELSRTSDPELQRVYRELSEFEETHVRRLKERLAEERQAQAS